MHRRKIRTPHSGTANLYVSSKSTASLGETYHDQVRSTITQTTKHFPTLTTNHASTLNPRNVATSTFNANPNPNKISVLRSKFHSSQSVKDKRESYIKDNHSTNLIWLHNKALTMDEKLGRVQKLLRARYSSRNRMFNIFNGWEGESKGYIDHNNLKEVLGLMGINLTEDESKEFIRRSSNNDTKLSLNNFLNVIYPQEEQEVESQGSKEAVSQEPFDKRFKCHFLKDEIDCSQVHLDNVNSLGSYQLEKAVVEGGKLKRKLQKYIKTPEEARQLLFSDTSEEVVSFESVKKKVIEFLKEKKVQVKWRELQGFLSLFQYNVESQLSKDSLCQSIFEDQTNTLEQFAHQNPPPVDIQHRQAKITSEGFHSRTDIPKCLKKLDQELFRGSTTYNSLFKQFDKDHDGFVSQKDFVEVMRDKALLTQQESKAVFEHIGGSEGKYQNCIPFESFVKEIRGGMGEEIADQYPNFLRPKRISEYRNEERFTKSTVFDPKSTFSTDQMKTRFNATPVFVCSKLGDDGTRFWGKSGDLNSKISFQKREKEQLNQIQAEKMKTIAAHRQQDQARRDRTCQVEDSRCAARLQSMWGLRHAYETVNHSTRP